MSTIKSGNATHDLAVAKAESIRQAATVPGATPKVVMSADIAHYRACVASALANGVNAQQYILALQELGTGGV